MRRCADNEITTPTESFGISHVIWESQARDVLRGASRWTQGLEGSNFGYRISYDPPRLEAYLYTDRLSPGRRSSSGRSLARLQRALQPARNRPAFRSASFDDFGEEIETFDLPLSIFGRPTGHIRCLRSGAWQI
jgi:hypothetical protein